jgi:hypothetical protein
MLPPADPLPPTDPDYPTLRTTFPTVRGIAVASIGLGFFSMIVFWWYPFGWMLSTVGLVLGVTSLVLGIRGGYRGENLAIIGTSFCAISWGTIFILTQGLRIVMWDH